MKTKRTSVVITLSALVALVALVALGIVSGTRHVQATAVAAPTGEMLLTSAEATSENLPPGTYTTTITEADIPPGFPPEAIPILVGEWQIEFTEAGSLVVTKDGDIVVVGHYNSNPFRVALTDQQGALACTDAPGIATGIYQWSFANDELVLTTVRDRCAGRNLVLTAHPLQKQ
jgi:hypothetical protein